MRSYLNSVLAFLVAVLGLQGLERTEEGKALAAFVEEVCRGALDVAAVGRLVEPLSAAEPTREASERYVAPLRRFVRGAVAAEAVFRREGQAEPWIADAYGAPQPFDPGAVHPVLALGKLLAGEESCRGAIEPHALVAARRLVTASGRVFVLVVRRSQSAEL